MQSLKAVFSADNMLSLFLQEFGKKFQHSPVIVNHKNLFFSHNVNKSFFSDKLEM